MQGNREIARRPTLVARRASELRGDVSYRAYGTQDDAVPVYLQALIREAANGAGDAGAASGAELEDPELVRAALKSIAAIQRELVDVAWDAVAGDDGDDADEAPRTFDALARSHDALLDRWFEGELRRRMELLGRVFHDLRSPLTSILFLSEALQAGQSGPVSEIQRHQIRLIYSAAMTLLTLVENVMSSRNLELGESRAARRPFSVRPLLEEVERVTRPLAQIKGLNLEFRWEGCGPRTGDPDALRRILLNLVTNAISFTESGRVVVIARVCGPDLLIRIEDTGPGIDGDELDRLFLPFRNGNGRVGVSARAAPRLSGAGLGLSICRRLADLLGGTISVESEPGRGSTFEVSLPFPSGIDATGGGG